MGRKKTNNDPLVKKPSGLVDQLTKNSSVRSHAREKKRKRKDEDDEFVGTKESKKILKLAREQQNEMEMDDGDAQKIPEKDFLKNLPLQMSKDSESDDNDDDDSAEDKREDDDVTNDDDVEEDDIIDDNDDDIEDDDEDDKDSANNKDTSHALMSAAASSSTKTELSDDLVKLFKGVGKVLSVHRSGPVPKPLKIIPKYRIWMELLELTDPDNWSAAAVLAATRIFVSNLKDKQAAKYMNRVLLPRIRDDIGEYKRLNDHLYQALIKCMFKSYGFIKGFLLPLCKEGDCTAREATIIASVIARSSMKMEHSAAAMMELCQMPYSPANCIFLTTLLDKKYALPYVVVDEIVNYFLRFQSNKQELPVLWHQCLLTFAQRYKQDVSSEQKEALLQLLKSHPHKDVTPEIRQEFVNAKCRDIEM